MSNHFLCLNDDCKRNCARYIDEVRTDCMRTLFSFFRSASSFSTMPYVIVGLGNPTEEYEHTRHNLGRMAVGAALLKAGGTLKFDKKINAERGKALIGGATADFVLPNTYMNKSGAAVAPLVKSEKAAEKLIVVYDEIDLPLGTIRMAFDRGSGGHRGVESVIKALKTRAFIRIRIGVCPTTPGGKPKKPTGEDAVVDFLLGNLNKKEEATLQDITKRVYGALELIVSEGRVKAMNQVNQG